MKERRVIRCRGCSLNQLVTANGLCRRCRAQLEIPFSRALSVSLRILRQALGLTQQQLADRVERLQRTHISVYENARKSPTLPKVHLFAEALGVSDFVIISFAEAVRDAAG